MAALRRLGVAGGSVEQVAARPQASREAAIARDHQDQAMTEHGQRGEQPRGKYLLILSLTALGVVYGDIGTSPLYAVRESLRSSHGIAVVPTSVLGVLSLILWSLVLVISVKYLVFVLRADNRGEGGILALTALVTPRETRRSRGRWLLLLLGLFGTALLYGDGIITPAISVLSAVEGLKVATPFFEPYIIPITIVILVSLFAVQRRGTAGVGKLFGPVTMLWFVTIAVLGVYHIIQDPKIFAAINPCYAGELFTRHGVKAFFVLGSVFLVVTGGEALYADLGHFGSKPIRLAWFVLVLPALLLNYFGQGAMLLQHPAAIENPFYLMVPKAALYPVVLIATAATVIASQALITGAFSLTMQAAQLGYSPRVRIDHTSEKEMGQIYIPGINWALMVACIGLVLGFRTSSNLAAAYGVAVTTTMVITTVLFYVVARERWKWPLPVVGPLCLFLLIIDTAFFAANILKIPDGGWFPLTVGGIVFVLMSTWKRGRQILGERLASSALPIEIFIKDIAANEPHRVPGTVVFMYGNRGGTPPALLHSLKHYKVLHEHVVFLAVATAEVPRVPVSERAEVESLGAGFYRITLRYGFMQSPNVPEGLKLVQVDDLDFDPNHTSFVLGRESLIPSDHPGMARWRGRLFSLMSRNARPATAFFGLPPNRVVEIGAQIRL